MVAVETGVFEEPDEENSPCRVTAETQSKFTFECEHCDLKLKLICLKSSKTVFPIHLTEV
jgi:hypothetical protein